MNIVPEAFVHGRGHRRTSTQKNYEEPALFHRRILDYEMKLQICGPHRNSFSGTDHGAAFIRMKRDYMGNDQLLPAYNVQMGVSDEYIVAMDVRQDRSDMDCFVPLVSSFRDIFGFYPYGPPDDAGYGSFTNYIFCNKHDMVQMIKFLYLYEYIYEKNAKMRSIMMIRSVRSIFRSARMVVLYARAFRFVKRRPVRGNKYGREEEIRRCGDCSGCQLASKCKKTSGNRTIALNQELTALHEMVIFNLPTDPGIRLCINRSIQAEGTFGGIKWNRQYTSAARRRGPEKARPELMMVAIGYHLYKFRNKQVRAQKAKAVAAKRKQAAA